MSVFYVKPPNDSIKEYGEEIKEDAVYTVYLKTINYPTLFDDNDFTGAGDENCQVSSTKKILQIKYGTLERIIKCFIIEEMDDIDSSHINTFLSTFRTYSSTKEVLECLIRVYDDMHSASSSYKESSLALFRRATKTVIITWVDKYLSDFNEPPDFPVLKLMLNFVRSRHHPEDDKAKEAFDYIQHLISHKLDMFEVQRVSSTSRSSLPSIRSSLIDAVDDMMDNPCPMKLHFSTMDTNLVAEQLTYTDAELFKKVVPHECLNHSRRGKPGVECPSVELTRKHFNDVAERVVTTILKPSFTPFEHPKKVFKLIGSNISTWIRIAQKVRELKNFSSLYAIIGGLQSEPIVRLKSCWRTLDKATLERYDELANICCVDDNLFINRQLLEAEGTTMRFDSLQQNVVHGTVPYLGIFLKDLTMLNEMADRTESGLINFDKKRREFDVLVRIQMLQQSAKQYSFQSDASFQQWFESLRVFDENEAYQHSLSIEPIKSNRRLPSTISLPPSSEFFDKQQPSNGSSVRDRKSDLVKELQLLDVKPFRKSFSSQSLDAQFKDGVLVKVRVDLSPSIESKNPATQGVNYKTIFVTNKDRTHNLIARVLEKFGLEQSVNANDLIVVQDLPPPAIEVQITDRQNVLYALNKTVVPLTCVVRQKNYVPASSKKQSFWRRKSSMPSV